MAPLSQVKHRQDHQQPQIRAFPVSYIPLGSIQGSVILGKKPKNSAENGAELDVFGVVFEPLEIGEAGTF